MKLIQIVDAEGTILCHNITQITKGVTKDAVFRKDHVATRGDIPIFLSMRKNQLYVWEKEDGMLHKDDTMEIPCGTCEEQNMECSQAKEEKIELTAACDGLLKVDNRGLKAVDGLEQMMIAVRHGDFTVEKGGKPAGTRIIPLVIEEEEMEATKRAAAEATKGCPILELKPPLHKKADIVTTGNEVFYGHIQDTFTPVIQGKLPELDAEVIDHVTQNDDDVKMTTSILDMIQKSAGVVACMDGTSVDPGGRTPLVIRNTGVDIVSYGAPVLPGAMFLLAYCQVRDGEDPHMVAIMGLPGYVIYAKRTIFDLVLSRIMTDDQVTADDLAALGQDGLYLNCPERTFPNCRFGKGM